MSLAVCEGCWPNYSTQCYSARSANHYLVRRTVTADLLQLSVFTIFWQLFSSASLLLLSAVSLPLGSIHYCSSAALSLGLTSSQGSFLTRHRRKLDSSKNIWTLISSFLTTLDSCLNSIHGFHHENKQQLINVRLSVLTDWTNRTPHFSSTRLNLKARLFPNRIGPTTLCQIINIFQCALQNGHKSDIF